MLVSAYSGCIPLFMISETPYLSSDESASGGQTSKMASNHFFYLYLNAYVKKVVLPIKHSK